MRNINTIDSWQTHMDTRTHTHPNRGDYTQMQTTLYYTNVYYSIEDNDYQYTWYIKLS